jgi:dTDP-4-dehydrorhamnose 3,5-epimerase
MYWIPAGFAHGFLTLEDDTVFFYKCTNVYNKEAEGCIRWNDPDLNIDWGIADPFVSERDTKAPPFSTLNFPFYF